MSLQDGKRGPGQKIYSVPFTVWNNAMDAGRDWAGKQLTNGPPDDAGQQSHDVVKIRNNTGSDLDRGDVLCLDSFDLDDLNPRYLWFVGEQPTTAEKPYGVLLQPIPAGKRGFAQISGICLAKIANIYADHPFAHIVAASDQLQTDWHGQAEIIHRQQVDAQWWAVVRLSNYQSARLDVVITEAAGIAAGASGTASVN